MTLAGRYRLVSAGVEADVGTVHDGYDTAEDRPVTVLVLPPGLLPGAEALRRLIDLQVAVADLGQPGLVPYEHAGILSGRAYLVRPSLPYRSLGQILARRAPLEIKAAVEIALRLSETLAPLHRAGLVHGSLSPHSVLAHEHRPPGALGSEWTVSVVDIGLLPMMRNRDVPARQAWGRNPYFSPEQAAGLEARASSDVYVVASLLYAMLAGRPPFRGADPALVALQHLRQEPPSLDILVPGIPPRLAEVVEKALDKEPANRYRNAGQMAYILRGQWAEMVPTRPAPTASPTRDQLVVPAPSPRSGEMVSPLGQTFAAPEEEKEPALANCLTVALLVLALVAVLGLIPLWRTLYRRYAAPSALPTPSLERWSEPRAMVAGEGFSTESDGPPGQAERMPRGEAVPGFLLQGRLPVLALSAEVLAEPARVDAGRAPARARNWSSTPFSAIMTC
jgi:serine/threonine-protein kinase